MLERKKIGRNDPCWCGSGKKFKKCHLNRGREKPLPLGGIHDALRRNSKLRTCLHPAAGPKVCDRTIAAHTIQRSRVLRRLIDSSQHVLTFHPRYGGGESSSGPYRVGWRRASTITGFCARHDQETFGPLEAGEFFVSHEQCFLLGYRALCHELFTKMQIRANHPTRQALLDRGKTLGDQIATQEIIGTFQLAVDEGLEDLGRLKEAFDPGILSNDPSVCDAVAVEFVGALSLATTANLTPDIDFEGRRLQDLEDLSQRLDCLSVASDATEKGGAIVFSWQRGARAPRLWVESLVAKPEAELLSLLPQLLLFYAENNYFSSTWWNGLSDESRGHLRELGEVANPYYTQRRYRNRSYTPWTLKCIHRFGSV